MSGDDNDGDLVVVVVASLLFYFCSYYDCYDYFRLFFLSKLQTGPQLLVSAKLSYSSQHRSNLFLGYPSFSFPHSINLSTIIIIIAIIIIVIIIIIIIIIITTTTTTVVVVIIFTALLLILQLLKYSSTRMSAKLACLFLEAIVSIPGSSVEGPWIHHHYHHRHHRHHHPRRHLARPTYCPTYSLNRWTAIYVSPVFVPHQVHLVRSV